MSERLVSQVCKAARAESMVLGDAMMMCQRRNDVCDIASWEIALGHRSARAALGKIAATPKGVNGLRCDKLAHKRRERSIQVSAGATSRPHACRGVRATGPLSNDGGAAKSWRQR